MFPRWLNAEKTMIAMDESTSGPASAFDLDGIEVYEFEPAPPAINIDAFSFALALWMAAKEHEVSLLKNRLSAIEGGSL